MASVNFLYRSKRKEACLTLRFLFRQGNNDNVISVKTNLIVTKEYWENIHFKKRMKNPESSIEKVKVQDELSKLESHIINAFNDAKNSKIDKSWLNNQIKNYYQPKKSNNIPENLIDFIEFYIDYRKEELKPASVNKYRVIKN